MQKDSIMLVMPKKLGRFLLGLVNLVLVIALTVGIQALLERGLPMALARLLTVAALLALYLVGARWIERRKPEELRPAGSALGLGGARPSGSPSSPA